MFAILQPLSFDGKEAPPARRPPSRAAQPTCHTPPNDADLFLDLPDLHLMTQQQVSTYLRQQLRQSPELAAPLLLSAAWHLLNHRTASALSSAVSMQDLRVTFEWLLTLC